MAQAAGSTWLVFAATGTIEHVTNGPEADVLEGTGWKAFATQAEAQAYAGQSVASRIGGQAGSVANAATGGAVNDAGGITSFLGDLTQRALWLRVARIVAGFALIVVGLVQLTHAQNLIAPAAKAAALA
jgi:hypothetical protein